MCSDVSDTRSVLPLQSCVRNCFPGNNASFMLKRVTLCHIVKFSDPIFRCKATSYKCCATEFPVFDGYYIEVPHIFCKILRGSKRAFTCLSELLMHFCRSVERWSFGGLACRTKFNCSFFSPIIKEFFSLARKQMNSIFLIGR